ncbi:CHAT domain-containing protein [Synechococcus sp. RSCCF101]|uniref:CHAT domain-containing protein n=1 Tax=Synechococcus sp. RSCCF101 TaxID=2511069 RepID=UPI00177AA561|nr:CHAT domain-containing protein [Synechococcus sp. RSCCF101]
MDNRAAVRIQDPERLLPQKSLATYTPAILRFSFTKKDDEPDKSFLDLTLIPPEGEVVGRRVSVGVGEFASLLRRFYQQLARQESLNIANPASPARRLHALLIAPLQQDLEALGISTLLISVDAGLQAVPFAALHDGTGFFGSRYAFSITPSIALTPLDVVQADPGGTQLSLGVSEFDGLAPLPLVPQEMERAGDLSTVERHTEEAFTPDTLLTRAVDPSIKRVHLATHAEFLPGGPDKARLMTGQGPMSLREFAALRQREGADLLDLVVLSACRTALGDQDSELGFAGLALQAGARSAMGSLWYVDDVATSALMIQFYRLLDSGLPKGEALQATRLAMADGTIRLEGDQLIGIDGVPLLTNLNTLQRRRVGRGFQHPFFWGGIALLGTPW